MDDAAAAVITGRHRDEMKGVVCADPRHSLDTAPASPLDGFACETATWPKRASSG